LNELKNLPAAANGIAQPQRQTMITVLKGDNSHVLRITLSACFC